MQNPRIVAVALRRRLVIRPAGHAQGTVIPALRLNRRICHNVIEVQSLVQIVQAGITGFAKIMADTAQSKVHFGKAIGGRLFFLSAVDTVDVTLLGFYKRGTLDKHLMEPQHRFLQRAVIRLNHRCDKLNSIMRRVELALFLGGIDREILSESIRIRDRSGLFLRQTACG